MYMATNVSNKPLSDRVRVALVMGAGKIKPVWFERTDLPSRERIMVKEICYSWQYLEGTAKILCYAVSDGVNAYKLELNTKDFTWRLGVADSQPC
jgi:hypothetical protein